MITFWIIMILALSFIELVTINLVTIWFVASAIVALILSLFIDEFVIQFGTFVVLGIILLLATRTKLVEWLDKSKQTTNYLDRVMEMEGIVIKEISKNKNGQVKLDGKYWTASSNKQIEEGKTVKVVKIDGVKLIVEEE